MTGKKIKDMHTQINLVYNPIAALENKDRTNKGKSELGFVCSPKHKFIDWQIT
jgi:hypothetical protein